MVLYDWGIKSIITLALVIDYHIYTRGAVMAALNMVS